MTVKLYSFGKFSDVVDPSPFCFKLDSFLRLAKIDYETMEFSLSSFGKAPKGKIPFIEDDGKFIADSNLIIEYLSEKYKVNLNKDLSEKENGISHSFCRMLDENTYWVALYGRWFEPDNFEIVKYFFFNKIPKLIRPIAIAKAKKNAIARINGQGIGLHSKDEIYKIGMQDMQALSDLLGSDDYFFNKETPSLLDITAHSYIACIILKEFNSPLKDYVLKLENLIKFNDRMNKYLYS